MFVLKKLRSMLHRPDTKCNTESNMTAPHPTSKVIEEYDDSIDYKTVSFDDINAESPDKIEELNTIPSIYVDAKFLEPSQTKSYKDGDKYKFVYEINGDIFWDDTDGKMDGFVQFEVLDRFGSDFKEEIEQDVLENNDVKEQLQNDLSLSVSIQNTPYGLVINSSILVTENGWNTIICEDNPICVACNRSLDIREIANHISTDNHKNILEKLKPLKKFDINIVRMINNTYHCAVCNILFDNIDHLESASHGDRILMSINKLSDITETDNDYSDCNDSRNNDCSLEAITEDSSGIDIQSCDGFYDYYYVDNSDTETDKGNQQANSFSYADIAKKPKTYTTGEYVEIKLDEKYAKVSFDSYNMVVGLKPNNFYCMACKEFGLIRFKSEHCLKVSHVENVMKCTIVQDFKEHVIRKVDDKLYHCGHCNHLYMTHEIRDHIERKHIRKPTNFNISEKPTLTKSTVIKSTSHNPKENCPKNAAGQKLNPTSSVVSTNNNSSSNNNNKTGNANNNIAANSVQKIDIGVNDKNKNNENPNQMAKIPSNLTGPLPMNSTVVIKEFGHTYWVSLLAFNFIQHRRPNEYFCWLCDVWCTNTSHLLACSHLTKLIESPFLPQTSIHLIRQIKYGFHCVICNVFIRDNPIHHTRDNMHLTLLNRAIYTPPPTANYTPPKPLHLAAGPPLFYSNNPSTSVQTVQATKAKTVKEKEATKNIKNTDNEKNDFDDIDDIAHNDNKVTETEQKDFDTEDHVYVKVKNIYTKITMTAYNSLVLTGNGTRYCVLCSKDVYLQQLKAHVTNPEHITNMDKCKFLKKYERHLIRQMPTCYHCALCNVCIITGFLNDHISWSIHKEIEAYKIAKHVRRNEIKAGVKEITCLTQDEIVNHNMKNDSQVLVNIEFRSYDHKDIVKKKKIIKLNGVGLKLSWDAFHGICKHKSGYKCLICQTEFKNYELSAHVENSRHMEMLENCFKFEFAPALIRKVNDSILHCLTCNLEVNNETHAISDHIASKRHVKTYKTTVSYKSDKDIENNDILILTKADFNKKFEKKN